MDLKKLSYIFLLCFSSIHGSNAASKIECSKRTLSLLNVVFRHGNKTLEGSYPTDPYKNETYYPFGKGELTNDGKLMGYRTGSYLRTRYAKFLGTYSPGVLEAYSSPSSRCKSYLQLILASLYPPGTTEKWHPQLNWQPIPFNANCTLSKQLFWTYITCPNFKKSYEKYKESVQYSKIIDPYKKTINYIENASGLIGVDNYIFGPAIVLHAMLLSEHEWGLPLPSWAEKIWPEELERIAGVEWSQMFGIEDTRIAGAGFLMSKIINDIYLKINKNPSVQDRKIYLYVGHDANIYATLAWLNVLKPEVAPYGSYIIFELHNIRNEHYMKILHQNQANNGSGPIPIRIPDCGYCCSLTDFMNLYSHLLHPEKIC